MITRDEGLVSLEELQSVLNAYAGPSNPRKRPAPRGLRRLRPLTVAAIVTTALAVVSLAIAADFGAFDGISAAEHPPGAADSLDPALVAGISAENARLVGTATGQLLPDSARFIRQLTSGERIYALSTTTDMLCVLIVGRPGSNMGSATSCGDPLNQNEPTTIGSVQANSATPPLAYGVAIDGITSVSFMADGAQTSVPVKNNVWGYEDRLTPSRHSPSTTPTEAPRRSSTEDPKPPPTDPDRERVSGITPERLLTPAPVTWDDRQKEVQPITPSPLR